MKNIQLLDCTLRDGGYVNDWHFGQSVINIIVRNLFISGVDVIELGYLSTKNANDKDAARYSSLENINRISCQKINDKQDVAVMINLGEYPVDLLSPSNEDSPILRVAFHKKDVDAAFSYFSELTARGYRYYIQPMGALNYTDEEYVHLIHQANSTTAEAFYVVDSFGVMELKDFRRLLFLADNNLRSDILLGYHAHNNLQQAYSNAKYMVEQNPVHDLVIDASVFGMGRGAGNLNLELFAMHLNNNYDKSYNIEPMLEVYDECLKPIFARTPWGYSLPYYLSAKHNCHPNYATYFAEKNTLSVKSMHEILNMITDEDKINFSKDKAFEYYNRYQESYIDDSADLALLNKEIEGREILVLAPGKSILDEYDKISEYILSNNPIIIGVNRASCQYRYDFLFTSNEKRLTDSKPSNVGRFIKTSNLKKELPDTLRVNYASYTCSIEEISDNPTLMLLNLLISLGVSCVKIAGFDGFYADSEKNYFDSHLSLGSSLENKLKKNNLIRLFISSIENKIDITFLTNSLYIEQ